MQKKPKKRTKRLKFRLGDRSLRETCEQLSRRAVPEAIPLLTRVMERTCGSCRECCVVPEIEELGKPAGTACIHLCETGCGIRDKRPVSCRGYYCHYRLGAGDSRPNESYFMVSSTEYRGARVLDITILGVVDPTGIWEAVDQLDRGQFSIIDDWDWVLVKDTRSSRNGLILPLPWGAVDREGSRERISLFAGWGCIPLGFCPELDVLDVDVTPRLSTPVSSHRAR